MIRVEKRAGKQEAKGYKGGEGEGRKLERGAARGEKRKWKELKKGTDWRWGEARIVKGNGRNEQRDWKWGKERRGKRKLKE